jgi:predicted RNA-binding Zn-ribbon protein involved in translation (DUF1610 family)
MSTENASTFDWTASDENASAFDCPECDVIVPSASVPYDALGYAVCPSCAYSATPTDDS